MKMSRSLRLFLAAGAILFVGSAVGCGSAPSTVSSHQTHAIALSGLTASDSLGRRCFPEAQAIAPLQSAEAGAVSSVDPDW